MNGAMETYEQNLIDLFGDWQAAQQDISEDILTVSHTHSQICMQ